ncbi:TPA: TraR/DksA family transcriptional regulator [Pseudomonas aeruginosa]
MLTETEVLALPEDEFMGPAMLVFFKHRLMLKREEVSNRLTASRVSIGIERQADDADNAANEEFRTLAITMAERDRTDLVNINEALRRIEDDEYGWCAVSGEPISVQRLLLVPESKFSVEVMASMEAKAMHRAKFS